MMKTAAFILALFAAVASGYLGWQEYTRPPPKVIAVPVARVLAPSARGSDFQLKQLAQLQVEALQQTMKELEQRDYDVKVECATEYCWRGFDIDTSNHYRVQVTKTTELR